MSTRAGVTRLSRLPVISITRFTVDFFTPVSKPDRRNYLIGDILGAIVPISRLTLSAE